MLNLNKNMGAEIMKAGKREYQVFFPFVQAAVQKGGDV